VVALASGCHKHRVVEPRDRIVEDWPFETVAEESWENAEPEDEMDITIPPFDPIHGAGESDQIKARFRGKDRKGPKTSIVDAEVEDLETIDALVESLPADDDMVNHSPPLKKSTNVRMTEEERNVRVEAWIYAIKYEADQDWHIIAGTDPDGDSVTYFNTEVSGVPQKKAGHEAPDHDALLAVREALADLLHHKLPGPSGYRKYTHPIPVVIEGSLFFDVDHPAGNVGPAGMKPETAWEIHPITSLEPQPGH
jgi:hypothetical protein